jgi:MtfA peptidase
MLFSWLRRRRRHRLLAEPFPKTWLAHLVDNVAHYSRLSEPEQARLRDSLRVFIAEMRWEGCGGLEITEEMKVTIAAQACLLVLNLPDDDYYARISAILVYPQGFVIPRFHGTDIVLAGGHPVVGQAVYRGPVILSWENVLAEGREPDRGNTVFHEFAHQLDMLDGVVDGTPPLENEDQRRQWRHVMSGEYQRLLVASEQGRATLLDKYGTTNEGEFFAVATECFFDRPVAMRRRHRQLYELLRDYYRQDPAARSAAGDGEN